VCSYLCTRASLRACVCVCVRVCVSVFVPRSAEHAYGRWWNQPLYETPNARPLLERSWFATFQWRCVGGARCHLGAHGNGRGASGCAGRVRIRVMVSAGPACMLVPIPLFSQTVHDITLLPVGAQHIESVWMILCHILHILTMNLFCVSVLPVRFQDFRPRPSMSLPKHARVYSLRASFCLSLFGTNKK